MTLQVRAGGADLDAGGFSYRIQVQQSGNSRSNGQMQIGSPTALGLTVGTDYTLTQLAAILEPPTTA